VKVDFRGATSLVTLSVDDCDDVTTIQVPPQLKQLVCSRLPRLRSLDLTAAPHMWALLQCCRTPADEHLQASDVTILNPLSDGESDDSSLWDGGSEYSEDEDEAGDDDDDEGDEEEEGEEDQEEDSDDDDDVHGGEENDLEEQGV
jgi:hypothetical protein